MVKHIIVHKWFHHATAGISMGSCGDRENGSLISSLVFVISVLFELLKSNPMLSSLSDDLNSVFRFDDSRSPSGGLVTMGALLTVVSTLCF